MDNLKKYNAAFIEVFEVEECKLNSSFSSENVENWDSMRKLNLLNIIEDEFEILFSPSEMLEFSSYEAGKQILHKHGVVL